jgi:hypothetical protein
MCKYTCKYNFMQKLKDKNTRKLIKTSKASIAVTLPKEIINSLGWREKQRVKVKRIKGGVEIKDYRS